MLRLPEGVRIWVATAPCDMRKQADGLSALLEARQLAELLALVEAGCAARRRPMH
ncbi:hypothetical protein [Myxococcus sp. RHSTA-1-4]|uniref:hypothetical protein n=1 Tax=Myxococcus sp. RHSTA-1-4 TaxID=2874601 RepID=UPI001CBFB1D2|nr:hypothetical protein [Myxococcus sp. RHSTA-1-4]MBZ4418310.1 hypothetical protein [Myxococcus sp. RHSTA-1-4]